MENIRFLRAKRYTNRNIDVQFGIIHHTASKSDCAEMAVRGNRDASWHFSVDREGLITQFTNLIDLSSKYAKKAWHAGKSTWVYNGKRYNGLNSWSIGIELAGDGNKWRYTDEQMKALYVLVREICKAFPVLDNPDRWLGHEQISPGRKVDPGKYFDWAAFKREVWRYHDPLEKDVEYVMRKSLWDFIAAQIPEHERNGNPIVAAFNYFTKR